MTSEEKTTATGTLMLVTMRQSSNPLRLPLLPPPFVAASDDMCEVCLIEPRYRIVLVPDGHSRFCSSCADAVASMPNG